MIAPARLAAYRALRDVNQNRADAAHALDRRRRSLTDSRDRALVTEIVLGTLRWRGKLDHIIGWLARRPMARLDPEVLDILRLSLFQLLHLERVPPAAVVADAVELARHAGKTSAAGLVNALLRRWQRERGVVPMPGPPSAAASREEVLDFLSVRWSHPRWLVSRWLDRYGPEAATAWVRFNNESPPVMLRVNRLRADAREVIARLAEHGVTVEAAEYAPDGLVVRAGAPLATSLAGSGLFFVQDEASQLVACLARPASAERVLDLCAAPGGKTIALAASMRDRGLLVACDLRPRRVALLQETVAAAGARSVRVVQADATQPVPFQTVFDWVVLDAPCTGLGTIRRDPDIRWRRTEADLAEFGVVQHRMLVNAAAAVRVGGRLLYATCSSEPEENEQVVRGFLETDRRFVKVKLSPADPALPSGVRRVLNAAGDLRTLPHEHGLEAFYGCVMRRAR